MQQAVINGLSEGEEQVFETIKSEVVSTIKQQGLFYADEIIDEKIEELEKSNSLSAVGLELIKDSLHTIPKVITLTAARQPEETVETVVAESNSKSWIRPCKGGTISSKFHKKRPNGLHNGVDIALEEGNIIRAVADGVVVRRRKDYSENGGYGYYIIISHGKINGVNVYSLYGHLQKFSIENKAEVKKGQPIGLSGNTGYSHGPHLHFEVRINSEDGKAVNPNIYVKL